MGASNSSGDVLLNLEPDNVFGERRATYFITLHQLDLDGSRTPADPDDDVVSVRVRVGDVGENGPHALNVFGSVNGGIREDDANMLLLVPSGELSGIWSDADETLTGTGGIRLSVDSIALTDAIDDLLNRRLYVEVTTVRNPDGELRGQLIPVPSGVDLKYFDGAGFQFTFSVFSPRVIRIESTQDFDQWCLSTNLVATNALVRSFDFAAADQSMRYYRVSELFFVHPSIVEQPEGVDATVGQSVQFAITATGMPEPEYQWFLDGELLEGATGSTLEIASVQLVNEGAYEVKVSSAAGIAYSEVARLTIIE